MKFLIVDNNPSDREMVKSVIRQEVPAAHFMEIEQMAAFEEALANDNFDMVLTDYRLGWSDGLRVLKMVKAHFPDVPVIMITDNGNEEVAAEGLRYGLSGYVLKRKLEILPAVLGQSLKQFSLRSACEEALAQARLSEERHRIVSELTSDYAYSFYVEPNGIPRAEWISESFTRVTGYLASETELKNGQINFVHPDDAPIIKRRYLTLLGNQPDRSTFRILTKSGEVRWLCDYGQPVWDVVENRVVRFFGAAQDITERKKELDTLATQAQILENLAEGVTVTEEGLITYTNPAFDAMFGYERGELLGKPVPQLDDTTPEESKLISQKVRETVTTTGTWHGEFNNRKKDGSPFISRAHISNMYLANRKLWLTVREDVTAIKETEHALRRSEQNFRTLAENAPDVISRLDRQLRYIYVNPAAERLRPISHQAYIGKSMQELNFAPKTITFWESIFTQVFETGQEQVVETNFNVGQSVHYHETRVIPEFDADGKTQSLMCITRDVTKLKQAERALATEKERLDVTLVSIGDGVIATDIKGDIVLINPAAETLIGVAKEQAMGKALNEIFQIKDKRSGQIYDNPALTVLQTGQRFELSEDTLLLNKIETEQFIEGSVTPILDKETKTLGAVVVFSDVTKKRKAEEEMLKADKLESVGILAGGIAHDFNNFLMAILGNISLAKRAVEQNQAVVRNLNEAEIACMHAKGLTQQLLTFSKGGSPIKKATSIAELLRESASFAVRGSDVRCDFKLPDDLWAVQIDEGQISRVISNLIINAQQAMPNGGVITVEAVNVQIGAESKFEEVLVKAGSYVKISLQDQGIGIPQAYLSKIFDPYFTTKQEGSGLGLAICYSIIKSHGGYITVDSKLGVGTIFCIYLPSEVKSLSLSRIAPKQSHLGKLKVLIMDDQNLILDFMDNFLSDLGHATTLTRNGTEAIIEYKQAMKIGQPFDVVIMDLTVPGGMGGKEAIKYLLEIDPQAKVIVSSGYSNDPVTSNYRQFGFKAVVPKPFDLDELAETLYKVVQEPVVEKSPRELSLP